MQLPDAARRLVDSRTVHGTARIEEGSAASIAPEGIGGNGPWTKP